MSKLRTKIRTISIISLTLLLGLSFFYVFHIDSMWQKALIYSKDGSNSLGVFVKALEWLSKNLKENETALVPMPSVFYVCNPELRERLVHYRSLWDSAGVILQANTTKDEILKVRSHFVNFLKENSQVKYVVRDWVDPYAKLLYEANVNDELMILIREAKVIPFTLSTGWSSKITIYERVEYTTLFAIELSSPPKQFFTLPPDVLIQYDSNGVTIQKAGPRVGFYLPLEEEINSSKQNYLTMQIRLDVEDLELMLVFYYDKNRDGRWSGYEIDYVKLAAFSQTEQGWVAGEWYKIYHVIPKADDPVVQIGIILTGDRDGALTLADLAVYSETTL